MPGMAISNTASLCLTLLVLVTILSSTLAAALKGKRIYHHPNVCEEGNVSSLHPDILTIPRCLEKWVDRESFWRRPVVKRLWQELLAGQEIVASRMQTDAQANSMLLYAQDKAVIWFQHSIFTLYPFLSIKMWFHLHFNSTTNLQLAFAHKVEGAFFYRRSTPWIDSFLMAVQPITGSAAIVTHSCIACRNCSANVPVLHLKNYFSCEPASRLQPVVANSAEMHKIHPKLFLHASDAHRISSIILNKDPCRYSGTPTDTLMLAAPVVRVLDRRKDRHFVNVNETMRALRQEFSSVSRANFEEKTFAEQATFLSDADILITAHGAAEGVCCAVLSCAICCVVLLCCAVCYAMCCSLQRSTSCPVRSFF